MIPITVVVVVVMVVMMVLVMVVLTTTIGKAETRKGRVRRGMMRGVQGEVGRRIFRFRRLCWQCSADVSVLG